MRGAITHGRQPHPSIRSARPDRRAQRYPGPPPGPPPGLGRRPFVAALPALAAAPAGAQEAPWRPDRPVTLVVPFAAGAGSDGVARIVAPLLAEEIGGTVVIENRPGANGAIAVTAAARARPDGTTIVFGTNGTHSANSVLMRRLDYDPVRDFAPVARIGHGIFVLVVGRHVPVRSLTELVAWARARPGGFTAASANAIGVVGMANLARRAGFAVTDVPYRSGPGALTDLVGGRVDGMMIDVISSRPQIQDGALTAIAVLPPRRTPLLPEIPSLAESGLGDFDLPAWYGLFLPAGAADRVVRTLSDATVRTVSRPEVRDRLAALGCEADPLPADAFRGFVAGSMRRWADMVEVAGVRPE